MVFCHFLFLLKFHLISVSPSVRSIVSLHFFLVEIRNIYYDLRTSFGGVELRFTNLLKKNSNHYS